MATTATIERLLHVLLRALPETTRKRYGDAIVQTILERVSHADGKLAASDGFDIIVRTELIQE